MSSPDPLLKPLQPQRESSASTVWSPDDHRIRPVSWAAERSLPVLPAFIGLFPGGMPRGATISVSGYAAPSLLLALLSGATVQGAWVAIAGWGELGWRAAAELGVELGRVVAVNPVSAPAWPNAMAALLDGFDIVLVASSMPASHSVVRRLAARARERGSILIHLAGAGSAKQTDSTKWQSLSDIAVCASAQSWEGLGAGSGRLRRRRVTIEATGRRVVGRRRSVEVWLPAEDGSVEPLGALAAVHELPGSGVVT